jgi:thioredoxin reductase/ferredoxin
MLGRYTRWLHTGWPAGTVEKLPEVSRDGTTRVPGVRVTGDLTGIPLLKFSSDTGARAVEAILAEPEFQRRRGRDCDYDLAIVGAGVSGIAAALLARKHGLRFVVYEAVQTFSTIVNFPKAKPIYTYPTDMTPAGDLQLSAELKETLLDELEGYRKRAQIDVTPGHVERVERKGDRLLVHLGAPEQKSVSALRVIVAIGRSGNYRKLGCPGETLDKVFHRLYDPNDFRQKQVLVVGGGDSAAETAVALCMAGAHVTLSYRKRELARPKPENLAKLRALEHDPDADVQVERPVSERVNTAMAAHMAAHPHQGSLRLLLGSTVQRVDERSVEVSDAQGRVQSIPNDVVFAMIGREPPLDFFRRSGIPIRGEWRASTWVGFLAFFAFAFFVYNWKGGTGLHELFEKRHWFPFNLPEVGAGALGKTISGLIKDPGFYYSSAYSFAIVFFGFRRIRRRRTPYVTRQTLALMGFQLLPLFVLPYVVLPWMGHAGLFSHGLLKTVGDQLFPDGSYWRAFGLVLAWPLFVWNIFNDKPLTAWLVIGLLQTFVLIPLIIRRWGKGAYCGWICSCGALAETLGDTQRQKMPHGPKWNRLNMLGQAILAVCFALLAARVATWLWPQSALGHALGRFYHTLFYNHAFYDYYHVVDLFLTGVVGLGLYFWFSGRTWCRFACPLAALMHIYARFSRFRIFADKKKCISCNVCTSVCHQGIDIMSFANKGLPMEDPQCVRCSACVQECPTGTLTFGRLDASGAPIYDRVPASPVQMREGKTHLRVTT